MRRTARWLFALMLRIFFRRVEVTGLENLPASGPTILVLNHPSALIDPMFVLALVPRPASFLAKQPLFRMPIIGAIVRALDSIPVYRKQDGANVKDNRRTFEKARELLGRGGVLALFPEGTSHDDPRMRALKTGAARIALGAAAVAAEGAPPIRIVPAGLTFTDKGTFRSEALLSFGPAFEVPAIPLDPDGEPPAAPVRELTGRIQQGLEAVVLQAERDEALALVARAERILAPSPGTEPDAGRLARQIAVRRRLLDGYSALKQAVPDEIAAVERRVTRYEQALRAAGLAPELVDPGVFRFGVVARTALQSLAFLTLLLPLALFGAIAHLPAYVLIDVLAKRFARGDASMLATLKSLAGAVFYPLAWAALAAGATALWGAVGLVAFPVAAISGYAALRFFEELDWLAGATRALGLFLFHRRGFLRLVGEREAIRSRILELAERLEALEPAGSAPA